MISRNIKKNVRVDPVDLMNPKTTCTTSRNVVWLKENLKQHFFLILRW